MAARPYADYRGNETRQEQAESRARQVPVVSREEFDKYWAANYNVSQRVTMIGPPGRGKTKLGFRLLKISTSTDPKGVKAVVLIGKIKSRDKTVLQAAKELNMRIVHAWPPRYDPRDRKRRGWILIPLGKPDKDTKAETENKTLQTEFGKAIRGNYHTSPKKPRITVVDESHQAQVELRLQKDIEAPLMRGRPDNAVWSFIQRGRHVSYHCYEAEHIFVFYDSDDNNQERYSEIGDVDKKEIVAITSKLETRTIGSGEIISQCLYMNRSGYMCIIDF
jgi:hypothetical protein